MSVLTLKVDEVMRTLSAESSNPFVVHDKEVDIVRFAINSGFADIVLDGQVALRVMYQRPGETQVRAQTLTYYDTDGLHNYYDWQLLSADLAEKGALTVALCILDISGGEVSEWHTTPCAVRVLSTIHTDDSDEGDDTITPTVKERVAVLETMIQRVASGAPIVVASASAMTDTEQIYVLSTDGKWYYHNGTTWVVGGEYGAVATDTTLTQSGIPADAKKTGDEISQIKADLSESVSDLKSALSTKLPFNSTFIDGGGKTEQKLNFPYVGWIRDDDGDLSPVQTAYEATDYIDLSGVTGIYRTGTTVKFALWTYAFYDANKTFISAQSDTTDYQIVQYEGKQVTWLNIAVTGAKYIRITNQPSREYEYYVVKQTTVNGYDVPHITINNTDPLKFYGKTIVNFGDSLFGNFRDTNETTDKSISKMISDATGATVYNCGFGGCRMSWHSEHWRAFSMFALADAITTEVWTDQDEAIASPPTGMPSYFADTLALLKSIDFSEVDYITIGYGVNDFNGNVFIDPQASLTEVQYFKGALDYSLRTILTTYPKIRIIVITPCWIWFPDSTTELFDYDSDDSQAVNTRDLALTDYVDACKAICEKYHVPCIDTYDLGFNKYSYKAYFNVKGIDGASVSDGVHPKQAGRQLRADKIVGQLEALY